ncbi:MAG: hypothetical protein DRJ52_09490 [Thermoprotei archaeon]|nr:MAG: hypothetical protein DRJ52_09490 [Thermoprotei archaeon]
MLDDRIGLSISSLPGYNFLKAVRKIRELGFQSIMVMPYDGRAKHSLGSFATLDYTSITGNELKKRVEVLKDFKHISVHQAWDCSWKLWIECASLIKAEIVTIHYSTPLTEDKVGFFREVAQYAERYGVKIGIENDGDSYLRYLKLIEKINSPNVGATIDVGHCALFEEVKVVDLDKRPEFLNNLICELLLKLSSKVFLMHLHNIDPATWRDHRSLPSGVIDVPRIIKVLREVNYEGFFVLELEERECEKKAEESGRYLDSLLREIY